MQNGETHISSYKSHAVVLIALLLLTFISVAATGWHFGAYTVAVALLIASIKVATVIINFMHVKHESLFIKAMISGVFVLFALIIIITFIDYYLR
ncbi:MAG TPA: cytochrome C oxidase subunit IV family protein [Bacteroidales bacterium]|nr:cytochrome C oxidase subunit IV family protein [Bacteroidales bacterium]